MSEEAAVPGTTGRRGLAGSAAVMFSGTLVSRLLGLVRNIVLVAAIGVTGAANSFSVANKLPNVVYMLVAGGVLNAILVPQIVRAMKGRDGGDEYVNRLLTLAGAALLVLTLLLTGGASLLVTVYAAELDPQWFALAVAFALWCIPQLFFYGMYTLLGQVLNARGIFGPYMWAPAVNNVVAILGLGAYIVLFGPASTGAPEDPAAWTPLRIAVVAGTATLGVAIQALVLLRPLARSGFRFRPRWGVRGSGLGRASRVATWAFASLAVAQLGFVAISNLAAAASSSGVARAVSAVDGLPAIASRASTGFVPGNAAWDNANFLYILPQSLITVSLVTALFTRVSTYAAEEDLAGVRADLSTGLRTIGVFTVFAGAALSVVALPLVQAILPTTTFPEAQGIARIVVALLAGIAALGALTMIQRVYYAFEDTRSLFRFQIPMTALVVVGCLVATLLPPEWWLVGAGVAVTASNLFGAVVAYLGLRRRLPSLDGARVLRTHLRLVLATVPAVAVGWGLLWLVGPAATAEATPLRLLQALGRVGIVGLVMAVLYYVLLRRLEVDELGTIARPVAKALAALGRRLPGPAGSAADRLARMLAPEVRVRTMSGGPEPRAAGTEQGDGALDGQETTRIARIRPGTTLAGRYRLEEELDSHIPGAEAWRGRDEILEREVEAVLLPGGSSTSAEALDAARRAALVSDPRLQRILDVGSQEGGAYIVGDTVDGPSLAELADGGALPVEQARAIVGEAASALESARRRGVHHLALGPSSVHVTADGQVLVTGTGVEAAVRGLDDSDPLATAREDAVGLVRLLYLALTGRWPSAGDPAAPGDVRPGVPGDLDALCAATLGPEADGPRTPTEIIRELAPWRDINVDALVAEVASGGAARPAEDTAEAAAVAAVPSAAPRTARVTAPLPVEPAPGQPPTPVPDPGRWAPRALPEGPRPLRPFPEVIGGAPQAPPPDPSGWRPHVPPGGLPPAPPFDAVLAPDPSAPDPAATTASLGRHARGSVVGATLAATAGGVATTVAATARTGTERVRTGVVDGRSRLDRVLEERAARRAAAADQASAPPADADEIDEIDEESYGPDPDDPAPARGTERVDDLGVVDDGEERGVPFRDLRIDPTPVVLLVALLLVVVGAVLAFQTLTADPEPREAATAVQTPTAPPAEPTPPVAPTTAPVEEAPPPVRPQIASLAPLDPEGDGAENPELTPLALDNDLTTFWRSRSYVDPSYGMKSGIGLAVTLAEPATVSEVHMNLHGAGGWVQVRAGDPANPTEGPVLAEGEMGPAVVLSLSEPTTTDGLILWFPTLPVADSDGRNRIELAELGVR